MTPPARDALRRVVDDERIAAALSGLSLLCASAGAFADQSEDAEEVRKQFWEFRRRIESLLADARAVLAAPETAEPESIVGECPKTLSGLHSLDPDGWHCVACGALAANHEDVERRVIAELAAPSGAKPVIPRSAVQGEIAEGDAFTTTLYAQRRRASRKLLVIRADAVTVAPEQGKEEA